MGVVVLLRQIGLVHVRMCVFSPVRVLVGVVVLDVFVLVAGVRVRVSNFVVAVFVGVSSPCGVRSRPHPLCSPR